MEEEIICNRWKDLADDFLASDDPTLDQEPVILGEPQIKG